MTLHLNHFTSNIICDISYYGGQKLRVVSSILISFQEVQGPNHRPTSVFIVGIHEDVLVVRLWFLLGHMFDKYCCPAQCFLVPVCLLVLVHRPFFEYIFLQFLDSLVVVEQVGGIRIVSWHFRSLEVLNYLCWSICNIRDLYVKTNKLKKIDQEQSTRSVK